MILDGEVVAYDGARPSFGLLQKRMGVVGQDAGPTVDPGGARDLSGLRCHAPRRAVDASGSPMTNAESCWTVCSSRDPVGRRRRRSPTRPGPTCCGCRGARPRRGGRQTARQYVPARTAVARLDQGQARPDPGSRGGRVDGGDRSPIRFDRSPLAGHPGRRRSRIRGQGGNGFQRRITAARSPRLLKPLGRKTSPFVELPFPRHRRPVPSG